MSKKIVFLGLFFSLLTLNDQSLLAGTTAQQVVTMSVSAINEIAITGSAPTLTINTATAGGTPTDATSSGITYALTTNGTNKKITGDIDSSMPANTTLSVNLGAPTGASSSGSVSLSTTSADLVTGITSLSESSKTLTYTFSATMAAGVVSSFNRTVTLTLTDGS